MAVVVAVAGWEWARLLGWRGKWAIAYGGMVLMSLVAWQCFASPQQVRVLLWLVALLWLLAVPMILRRGVMPFGPMLQWGWKILGLLVLPAAWLGVMAARDQGVTYLLSVLLLVWGADIGAYFAGKALGRRKLAPQISPGKSWEGAVGGWLLVLCIAILVTNFFSSKPTFYTHLTEHYGVGIGGVWLTLLVGMSIVGDLFESLLKRQAGVKDSSALLPGHGGVLDRIDALLPVLPLAALIF